MTNHTENTSAVKSSNEETALDAEGAAGGMNLFALVACLSVVWVVVRTLSAIAGALAGTYL